MILEVATNWCVFSPFLGKYHFIILIFAHVRNGLVNFYFYRLTFLVLRLYVIDFSIYISLYF
jgi:hypothetical protein